MREGADEKRVLHCLQLHLDKGKIAVLENE